MWSFWWNFNHWLLRKLSEWQLPMQLVMKISSEWPHSLQWRHNKQDGVSNHQAHDCLLNCLFRHISKKTPKLRVTGLCAGNSPVTGEFPAQMASNAENVSIWWRHHENLLATQYIILGTHAHVPTYLNHICLDVTAVDESEARRRMWVTRQHVSGKRNQIWSFNLIRYVTLVSMAGVTVPVAYLSVESLYRYNDVTWQSQRPCHRGFPKQPLKLRHWWLNTSHNFMWR